MLLSSSSSSSSSLLEWKVERRTSRTVESPLRKPARLNPPDLFKSSVCVCVRVCVCRSQRRRWLLHQIGFGSSVIFTPRAPIKGSRRRLCRRLRPTRPSTHSAHLALRERRWGWEGEGGASGSVSLSSTFHLSVPLFLATPGKNTHTALSLSSR